MRIRFVIAAMAALLLAPVIAKPGAANDGDFVESACSNSVRVSHSFATCLHGWYSNNYNWSPPGYKHTVENKCPEYGTVIASVDVQGGSDWKWTLTNGDKETDYRLGKTNAITCCADKSDLCYRSEVERIGSYIMKYAGSGTTYTYVNVDTHEKRYQFCQSNPDNIYCEVDPEGDANRASLPFNCGNHYCNVGDCEWNWNRSSASETCNLGFADSSMSISAEDGSSRTCTVVVKCQAYINWIDPDDSSRGGHWVYGWNDFSAQTWQMDELHNCSGTLQRGSC